MKLYLRSRLVLNFVAVIVITGIAATVVCARLIGDGIVREAQNKVTLDLNSARVIYQQHLKEIELSLAFTAMREFAVIKAIKRGDRSLLFASLQKAMKNAGIDFLTATDANGIVVIRARNPHVYGDDQSGDEITGRVLREKKSFSGTQIIPQKELAKESDVLAAQALILHVPTPRARPAAETESTAGMVLKAAVPLYDDENGNLLGVLYGGSLLNRNYEIVDTIKDVVYRGVKYQGKDIGTATIFQDDLRIATNVFHKNGERAIGTRVSSEVYDRVIGEGKIWTARAFVVNDWYLTAYSPVENVDGKPIGILYVGMLENKYEVMKQGALWIIVGLSAAGVLLSICISYLMSETIARPVRKLQEGIEAVTRGNFDFDVDAAGFVEINRLAQSFNRLRRELKNTYAKLKGKIEAADEDLKQAYKELQEKQEILVQKEKLASIGQLSAGVAHEINNPLGTILVFSHMLLKELPGDDARRADIEMIVNEANRCRDIVRKLLDFARQSRVTKEPADLAAIIEEVRAIMGAAAGEHGIAIKTDAQQNIPKLYIDATQIKQMLVNLVGNSIDAIDTRGEVCISARMSEDNDAVDIKVSDNGCGIAEEYLPKLFLPFFTTKEMGKGTGLGLAIAYGVVKMHSGNISVDSRIGEGTTFSIWIPLVDQEKSQPM